MNKWSSYKQQQLITEGWRRFLNEGELYGDPTSPWNSALDRAKRAIHSGDQAAGEQALNIMRLLNFRRRLEEAQLSELTQALPRNKEILQAGNAFAEVILPALNKALEKAALQVRQLGPGEQESWDSGWKLLGWNGMPETLDLEAIASIANGGEAGATIEELERSLYAK
jgi:hypothetical protein|tara:strand:- start:80 stop:586 length:507 start_codon:yes stop_codon:yes gene_type:complete